MKIRNDIILSFTMLVGDIVAINTAFIFSYWVRFKSGIFEILYGTPSAYNYIKILPVITIIIVFLMRSEKLYSIKSRLSIVDEFFLIVRAVTISILIFMAGTFIYREFSYSRGHLFVTWPTLVLFLSCSRLFVNRVRFLRRKHSDKKRNLLLIGDSLMVDRLIKHILGDPHWDYDVKGVVRIHNSAEEDVNLAAKGIPVVGTINEFDKIITAQDIDEVIMTELDVSRSELMKIPCK